MVSRACPVAAVCLTLLLLTACTPPFLLERPDRRPGPTGVTLSRWGISARLGDPAWVITARVLPDDARNKTVSWRTSNAARAQVSDGVVTFTGEGEVEITATDAAGHSATCSVSVGPPLEAGPPLGIRIEAGAVPLVGVGGTTVMTASVIPSNAAEKTITWTSDSSAVTIAPSTSTSPSTVLVTGSAPGSANITASVTDTISGKTYSQVRAVQVVTATPPAVSLVPSRTSGTGPLAVHFDASGTTSALTGNPFQDLLYTWDFGDGAGPADQRHWTQGSRADLARNQAFGPVAAHVFETPGQYTVTLKVWDGVTEATGSTVITVDDPESVYSGDKTVWISSTALPTPGLDGVPSGARVFQETTLEGALSHLTSDGQRILFRRGDTWTISGTTLVDRRGITLGAYGTASAKPVFEFVNDILTSPVYGAITFQGDDCRIQDIRFFSIPLDGHFYRGPLAASASHALVLRVDTQNTGGLFSGGQTRAGVPGFRANFLVDCRVMASRGGWGNTGVWQTYDALVSLGCLFDNTAGDIEHNFRTQGASKSVLSANTFRTASPTKHLLAFRGRPEGDWTDQAVVSDNLFDQGTGSAGWMVQFAPQNSASNEPLRNILFERNRIEAPRMGRYDLTAVFMVQEGLCIRNNLWTLGGDGPAGAIGLSDINDRVDKPIRGLEIYNNSCFTGASRFSFAELSVGLPGQTTGVKVRNNLVHHPNASVNSSGNSPDTMFREIHSALSNPENYEADHNSSPYQAHSVAPSWAVQPPGIDSDYRLSPGSYALDSGASVPVWQDYFGTRRTGITDLGAVAGP